MKCRVLRQQTRRSGICALAIAALLSVLMPLPGTAASAGAQLAAAAPGDPALYEVEVVIFRAAAATGIENWDTVPLGHGFGSATTRGGEVPMVDRLLTASDYRLDGVVYGLHASGAWQTVAHAAWIQTAPNWGTHVGIPLAQLGVDVPGLSGTIYLERAPIYLHLGFDISLQAQSGTTYTINEMRNVRQNEKQYFDHPAFGIIAVVTAVKPADKQPAAAR